VNFDKIKSALLGTWSGSNCLYLRWMTPQEYPSASTLHITPTVGGKFLALSYTWSHEDQPQEGLILVGYEASKDIVHASWIDSWHANEKPMALTGTITLQGNLDMRGSYSVENHPDWGWRIVLTPADTALQMRMYNVTPEGEEDLAVQADYHKQANS
jgi:hypothetical protein